MKCPHRKATPILGPDGELLAEVYDPPIGGSVFSIVCYRDPPWPRISAELFGAFITELLRQEPQP